MLKKRLVVSIAELRPIWGRMVAAKFSGVPGVWGVEMDLMRMLVPMHPSIHSMIELGHAVSIRASIIEEPMRVAGFCADMLAAGAGAVTIPSVTSDLFGDDIEALKSLRSMGGGSRWLHVEFDVPDDDGSEGDGAEAETADGDDWFAEQLPVMHTPRMTVTCVDADFAIALSGCLRRTAERLHEDGKPAIAEAMTAVCVSLPADEVLERFPELWAEPTLEICAVMPADPEEAMALTEALVETLEEADRSLRLAAAASGANSDDSSSDGHEDLATAEDSAGA